MVTPESLKWTFSYSPQNQIKSLTMPGDNQLQFAYTRTDTGDVEQMTRTHSNGSKECFAFDRQGRLTSIDSGSGHIAYDFDASNRIEKVDRKGLPAISYAYDTFGRISNLKIGKDFSLDYVYDFLGRLSQIKTPIGKVAYQYNSGKGQVMRTLPNGIRTIWEDTSGNGPDSISHVDLQNRIIAQFSYDYRADGLINSIEEYNRSGTQRFLFEYDKVQRIIAVKDNRGDVVHYEYDKVGNRLSKSLRGQQPVSYAYNWAGQLTGINSRQSKLDASGNLAHYTVDGQPMDLVYNDLNMLTNVTINNNTIEYQYGGDGLLIGRKHNDRETKYLPDPMSKGWRPLLAIESDGRKIWYVWQGDTLLFTLSDKSPTYFLHDHLDSVRHTLNDSGQTVDNFSYTPFGFPISRPDENRLHAGFAGLFFDPATNLYVSGPRSYDSRLGRFLQIDPLHRMPLGSQKDLSLYSYCGNDPLNYTDRTGLAPESNASNSNFFIPEVMTDHYKGKVKGYLTDKALEELDKLYFPEDNISIPAFTFTDAFKTYGNFKSAVDLAVIDNFEDALLTPIGAFDMLAKGTSLSSSLGYISLSFKLQMEAAKKATAVLNQIQSENLVKVPHAVSSHQNFSVMREMHDNHGLFSMTGSNQFTANGVWLRNSSLKSLDTVQLAQWRHGQVFLPNGTQYSGSFFSGVHKRVNNISGPLYQSTRVQHSVYHTSYNGLAMHKAVEEYNQTGIYDPAKWHAKLGHSKSQNTAPELPDSVNLKSDQVRPELDNGIELFLDNPFKYAAGGPPPPPPPPPPPMMLPSNVGGIYLKGAGQSLEHLNNLKGIMVDEETQRLILISEDDPNIDLPPIRLDDVVTIFRSVYEGSGPYVSIDPDPEDPDGPLMLVRHDEHTKGSYPGWVMFEADRVMKAYSLGCDNVSREKINSRISGYKNLFDLGFSSTTRESNEPIWERFWIVPDKVHRTHSQGDQLSVFDVALKVNTERMVMRNGRLETAPDGTASEQAREFSKWFADNYNKIAQESQSATPDDQSPGMVQCFHELRRIALVTAIAERLRSQGVPMPGWMLDYPVKSFACPKTTPAIVVEDSQTETSKVKEGNQIKTIERTRKQRIYGGVQLTADKDASITDDATSEADALAVKVKKAMTTTPLFKSVSVTHQKSTYRLVALPGSGTKVLGANRLSYVDLEVPVQRGSVIQLARHYNTCFDPKDVYGRGWTFNTPQLVSYRIHESTNAKKYQLAYRLTSSLGSFNERFSRIKRVPELDTKLLVPEQSEVFLGIGQTKNEHIGVQTTVLFFRDGRQWHFDDAGRMAAQIEGPYMQVFRRDKDGRISRIEGWYGKALRADLKLHYNRHHLLERAVGSNNTEVRYRYNENQRLESIEKKGRQIRYAWEGRFIKTVTDNGQVRSFDYDAGGALVGEHLPGEHSRSFTSSDTTDGVEMTVETDGNKISTLYNQAMQPIRQTLADGTIIDWAYEENNPAKANVFMPDGRRIEVEKLKDGFDVQLHTAGNGRSRARLDHAGRVTALYNGDSRTLKQKWHPNGLPAESITETTVVYPQYQDNVLTSHLIAIPGQESPFQEWLKIEYDDFGNPAKVTDYSGTDFIIAYEENGRIKAAARNGKIVKFVRNPSGQVIEVKTNWGYSEKRKFATDNQTLESFAVSNGKQTAAVEYDKGLLTNIRQFDGGETRVSYLQDGKQSGIIKSIRTPNDLIINFNRNQAKGELSVSVGDIYGLEYELNEKGLPEEVRMVPVARAQ